MSCARPKTMENKLPSPMPLPAWARVRVRAARWLPSGISKRDAEAQRPRLREGSLASEARSFPMRFASLFARPQVTDGSVSRCLCGGNLFAHQDTLPRGSGDEPVGPPCDAPQRSPSIRSERRSRRRRGPHCGRSCTRSASNSRAADAGAAVHVASSCSPGTLR